MKKIYDFNDRVIVFVNSFPVKDMYATEVGYSQPPVGWILSTKRKVYVMHFVVSGRISVYGKELKGGDCFLFTPQRLQESIVLPCKEKYEHYWIMFEGGKAKEYIEKAEITEYTINAPYFSEAVELLKELLFDTTVSIDFSWRMLSILYKIFALHVETNKQIEITHNVISNDYVNIALDYIQMNYMKNMTLNEIAHIAKISSKYLCKLFEIYVGCSPIRYLNKIRVRYAQDLLENTNLLVSEVAERVGFSDQFYFSRVFKSIMYASPCQYKEWKNAEKQTSNNK